MKIFSFSFESLGNGNAAPNINEVSGNVFVYETSLLPAPVNSGGDDLHIGHPYPCKAHIRLSLFCSGWNYIRLYYDWHVYCRRASMGQRVIQKRQDDLSTKSTSNDTERKKAV